MKRPALNWIPDAWPLLLSQEQVCAYLGLGLETFKKVCPVPPVDMGAHVVRYHRLQIEAWANALPPKLRNAQEVARYEQSFGTGIEAAAELAAEERRQESLNRARAMFAKMPKRKRRRGIV